MKIPEFNDQFVIALASPMARADMDVVIATAMPSLGGRQMSHIKNVSCGFDWEAGKLVITPSFPLYTRDQQTEIRLLTQQRDRAMLENARLKRQLEGN